MSKNKVYIFINHKDYSDIYYNYPKYPNSDVFRISKTNLEIDDDGEFLFIYLNNFYSDIVIDMIEGTDIWSYSGLVKLFAFKNKSDIEIFKKIPLNTYISDDDFVLKIEPGGDFQSITIKINKKNTSEHEIKTIIDNTLQKYFIKLVFL